MFESPGDVYNTRNDWLYCPKTIWEAISLIAEEKADRAMIAWDRDTPEIFGKYPLLARKPPDRLLLWRYNDHEDLGGFVWYLSKFKFKYKRIILHQVESNDLGVRWGVDGWSDSQL